MTDSNMKFPIPNEVLEPFIREAVSTAIGNALGDADTIIVAAVSAALSVKCNDQGVVGKDSYYNKYNLVETLAAKKIREIAKDTITEMAEQMRPSIVRQVRQQISGRNDEIAQALVSGMIDSLKCSWNIKVDFSPKKPE